MDDKVFRERAERILFHMALENKGWKGIWPFTRWCLSDEPLRHDASRLLQEAGVEIPKPTNTRLVGKD